MWDKYYSYIYFKLPCQDLCQEKQLQNNSFS